MAQQDELTRIDNIYLEGQQTQLNLLPYTREKVKTSGGLLVEGARIEPMVQMDPMKHVDVTAQGGELALDLATPSGHMILVDLGVQSVQDDMGPQRCPSIETYASLVTQCMTDELSHMIPKVSMGVVPMTAGSIVQAKETHDLMTKGPMAKGHVVRDSMARGSTMRGPLGKDLVIRGHATRRLAARGSTSRGRIQPTRGPTTQSEFVWESKDLMI